MQYRWLQKAPVSQETKGLSQVLPLIPDESLAKSLTLSQLQKNELRITRSFLTHPLE